MMMRGEEEGSYGVTSDPTIRVTPPRLVYDQVPSVIFHLVIFVKIVQNISYSIPNTSKARGKS